MLGTTQYFLGRLNNKFLGPEREAYWRGGLIEKEAKKAIYCMYNKTRIW